MAIKNLWYNLSVQKKLFSIVGVMAVLIAMELLTLIFAMKTLSAVRAFVGGEGLWSKAQKSAVIALDQYLFTKDESDYQEFLNHLKIPNGGQKSRLEMLKKNPDHRIVYQGLLEAANHEKDIQPMIDLMGSFKKVPIMADTLHIWEAGDQLIAELKLLGLSVHQEAQNGLTSEKKAYYRKKIRELDNKLTEMENQFSYTLGMASRQMEFVLMIVLLSAVVIVESTGLYLTYRFGKHLAMTLKELNTTAVLVGQGDFTKKVDVKSNDELGQLACSLNKMVERLESQTNERLHAEQASQAKNLFLANMSHEIRTPLNAILGFSEILQDQQLKESDRQRYAAIIRRTGESLNMIINDILDVSKIEADHVEIHETTFSLTQMLSDLYAVMKLRCDEKGIQLIFEKVGYVSEHIQSDQTRLRQILANILGNAIKFTEKGQVRLSYEVQGSYLHFKIQDTGDGISAEQRQNLFKVFSQGDSSVRKKYGGTGLGLSIAQKFSQLLGGDAGLIDSSKGSGSTFFFKIKYQPFEKIARDNAQLTQPVRTDLIKDKKILLVEDSLDNQLLIEFYLTKNKAQVFFAQNGLEAVEMATGQSFDLILMDIQMPILDGYAATEELRRKGLTIPIIALTGYAMKEDQDKCLRAGCNEFLAKPIQKEKLLNTIVKYFESSKKVSLESRPLNLQQ